MMALFSRLPRYIQQMTPEAAIALKAGAQLVGQSAKNRVPVGTGRLRDAIHTEDVALGTVEMKVAVVAGDNDTFYGHLVEHGTRHSPAEPFLVPALEENRKAIIALVSQSLRLR